MILFNINEVREFLKTNGEVYTLRKPGKPYRITLAIKGNYYKPTEIIGTVSVELVQPDITSPEQLKPYIAKSGLKDPKEWLVLAQQLSGKKLDLYHVKVIQP